MQGEIKRTGRCLCGGTLGPDRDNQRKAPGRALRDDGGPIRPVGLNEGSPEKQSRGVCAFRFQGHGARKLGAAHGSLLLIRPGGYLAFHRREPDPHHASVPIEVGRGRGAVPLKVVGCDTRLKMTGIRPRHGDERRPGLTAWGRLLKHSGFPRRTRPGCQT